MKETVAAGTIVQLHRRGDKAVIAVTETDDEGRFDFENLKPDVRSNENKKLFFFVALTCVSSSELLCSL